MPDCNINVKMAVLSECFYNHYYGEYFEEIFCSQFLYAYYIVLFVIQYLKICKNI